MEKKKSKKLKKMGYKISKLEQRVQQQMESLNYTNGLSNKFKKVTNFQDLI